MTENPSHFPLTLWPSSFGRFALPLRWHSLSPFDQTAKRPHVRHWRGTLIAFASKPPSRKMFAPSRPRTSSALPSLFARSSFVAFSFRETCSLLIAREHVSLFQRGRIRSPSFVRLPRNVFLSSRSEARFAFPAVRFPARSCVAFASLLRGCLFGKFFPSVWLFLICAQSDVDSLVVRLCGNLRSFGTASGLTAGMHFFRA